MYNVNILDNFNNINILNSSINNKLFQFINKANELVDLSDNMYQIEKTINLNKISLKGYVLDSSTCLLLKDNNIANYSIDELIKYMNQYEETTNNDCSPYYLALSLYKLLDDIEKRVNDKINLEISLLSKITNLINTIDSIDLNEYQNLYTSIKNELDSKYLQNIIDENNYNAYIQILKDIFDFYLNGYPNIPDDYLYHI